MLELMHEASQNEHADTPLRSNVLSLDLVHATLAAANALSRAGVSDDVGNCGLHCMSYCSTLKLIWQLKSFSQLGRFWQVAGQSVAVSRVADAQCNRLFD